MTGWLRLTAPAHALDLQTGPKLDRERAGRQMVANVSAVSKALSPCQCEPRFAAKSRQRGGYSRDHEAAATLPAAAGFSPIGQLSGERDDVLAGSDCGSHAPLLFDIAADLFGLRLEPVKMCQVEIVSGRGIGLVREVVS